jgi:hypothetical protein
MGCIDDDLWEERWEADVRASRALAALRFKDVEIEKLKDELSSVRNKIFNQSIHRSGKFVSYPKILF